MQSESILRLQRLDMMIKRKRECRAIVNRWLVNGGYNATCILFECLFFRCVELDLVTRPA